MLPEGECGALLVETLGSVVTRRLHAGAAMTQKMGERLAAHPEVGEPGLDGSPEVTGVERLAPEQLARARDRVGERVLMRRKRNKVLRFPREREMLGRKRRDRDCVRARLRASALRVDEPEDVTVDVVPCRAQDLLQPLSAARQRDAERDPHGERFVLEETPVRADLLPRKDAVAGSLELPDAGDDGDRVPRDAEPNVALGGALRVVVDPRGVRERGGENRTEPVCLCRDAVPDPLRDDRSDVGRPNLRGAAEPERVSSGIARANIRSASRDDFLPAAARWST